MIYGMKERVKPLALVGLICLVVVVAGVALFSMEQPEPEQATRKTTQPTASKTSSKSQSSSAKIQLELPGVAPIAAQAEDYNSPASLWTVVSKDYPLSEQQYRPGDLELTTLPARSDKSADERSVRALIVPDLTALFADAKAAGHDIMIASGFRSYDLQQTYFRSYSHSYGEEAASKFSARPGQSEHQTGLSLDIAYANRECYLDTCFGQKPAGVWLAANAHTYGFVLRYPADKTEVTKYQYEPWHFRYVGRDLAGALHESGLTLDEARPYLQEALAKLKAQNKI